MGERPIKALLIEDSVFATRHTQKMLAEADDSYVEVQLECVDKLSAGLERLAEDHIDIVLLDLTLPDSHDLDTFTRVRAQAPRVPVVVLTGIGDEKLAVEAVRKGAQDYLVKGHLDGNLLKRSILYAIERKRTEEELKRHKEHLEELVEERTAELRKANEQLRDEISERKRALEQVEALSKFPSEDPNPVLRAYPDGAIIYANDPALSLLKLSPGDIDRHLPEDWCQLTAAAFGAGSSTNVEFKYGDQMLLLTLAPLVDSGYINIYILDITDRKRAQQNLQEAYTRLEKQSMLLAQSEKMSAIGTLVAGTAHELNNPMMGILNFSAHCIKHTPQDDELYTILQDIEHEAKRCTDIVKNLLTFSHVDQDDDTAYQKESLPEIFDRVFRLLSYRIEKHRVTVTQHVAEDTPQAFINPNSIQQLVLNLITNALDALKDSEKKELNVDIAREGEYVRMTIADTGCGISEDSLNSIFDPFFTTKPVGHGTGLGLSVSQGIVKAHGGKITCRSKLGAGTEFTILLPMEKPEVSKLNV